MVTRLENVAKVCMSYGTFQYGITLYNIVNTVKFVGLKEKLQNPLISNLFYTSLLLCTFHHVSRYNICTVILIILILTLLFSFFFHHYVYFTWYLDYVQYLYFLQCTFIEKYENKLKLKLKIKNTREGLRNQGTIAMM